MAVMLSTKWLSFPVLNGRDYVDFVKLISQTMPCRAMRFNRDRSFRMGCQEQESICNILQKCPGAHYPCVRHHNDAVELLFRSLKNRKYKVYVEPPFPDLCWITETRYYGY